MDQPHDRLPRLALSPTPSSARRRTQDRNALRTLACLLALALALSACGGDGDDPTPSDAGATDSGGAAKDAGLTNNWAQGYTLDLEFHGGPADGQKFRVERDLYGIQTVFSFGSTHYTHGEVGFAMTDTIGVELDGTQSQVEVMLNYGLVVGSSVNPVSVDKAGVYPFSCTPPEVRILLDGFSYRSTCADLAGKFDIESYSNVEGGTMSGKVQGRLQATFPDTSFPDPCNAAHNAEICDKPDWYVDISGVFGFTLPAKDGGK